MISGIVAQQALFVSSGGGGGGGECDDYVLASPTSIITDLDTDAVSPTATAIDTNLCSEII